MSDSLADQFLAAVRPVRAAPTGHREGCNCRGCKPRPQMDDQEFAEFALRVVRAFEARVISNPEMLPAARVMAERAAEIPNVAIAVNAERYAVDPRTGFSGNEMSKILDVDKGAISRRKARGVAIMSDRIDRAGAARFAEAKREREALIAAAESAGDQLAAYRARRAS